MADIEYKTMVMWAVGIAALAIVTLMSIVVTDRFGYTLRDSTSTSINNLTLNNLTYTRVGSSGQYPYLQTLTGCYDASNASNTLTYNTDYTLTEGDTNGGYAILTSSGSAYNGTALNCSTLTYLADSTESTVASTFETGLTVFATFCAIIVLAIIGNMIVNIYRRK